MLARYDIACDSEQALHIKMGGLRGQRPATRAKYRKAIEACERMEHLEKNLSEFAGRFGVDGSGLARQLRTHYPGVLERREAERLRLGYDDRLPRGSRRCCREQYADAVELLRADRYVTVREAAESCGVSCSGLEQHLLFYHKELVARRIGIRKQAVGQQRKGEITGRGSTHAPSPAIVQKYAEALRLYRTTPQSAARIARQTNVSKKGFYAYLQKWHRESICERKNIPCEEGRPVDWSKTRKYNPATKAKRTGGFVMSGSASKAVAAAGSSTDVAITLKRTVAKVAVQVTPSPQFGSLYQGAVRIDGITLSNGATQTPVFPTKTDPGAFNFSTTQASDAASGKYRNLFYLYESPARNVGSRVKATIDATYDMDGDFSTAAGQSSMTYEVELDGASGGEIRRNGYYRVDITINGLAGHDASLTITPAEWESPVTQTVELGA